MKIRVGEEVGGKLYFLYRAFRARKIKPTSQIPTPIPIPIPPLGMQIRVRCGCDAAACAEWAIVELQGVVESQPSVGSQVQNLEIGRLCCDRGQGSGSGYTLTVGYHELTGTKMPLKKPVLVLKKGKKRNDPSAVELEVVGIIRHKILFKNRPKALISKPQIKEKKTVQAS